MLKNSETKYYDVGGENLQLYHDVGAVAGPTTAQATFIFNPFQYLLPGTGHKQRIGDSVIPVGIKIKLWLANKADRPNLNYRLIALNLPQSYNGTPNTTSNVDMFAITDGGSMNNTLIGILDKAKVGKVFMDRVVRLEAGTSNITAGNGVFSGKEYHKAFKFYFKMKRRLVQYQTGTDIHKAPFWAFYVIPYDSYGTLQTDNVASMAYQMRIYFKDP